MSDTDKQAIELVYQTLVKSLLKKDFARARSLYTETGAYVQANGELTRNEAELQQELARFGDIIAKMKLQSRSIHIVDDIALVVVVWHWADNAEACPQHAVDVLRKTAPDQWQFVIDNPMGL